MAAILGTIHPEEVIKSTAGIQALIRSMSEKKKTGVLRAAYPNEEHLFIFFKRGAVLTSMLAAPGRQRTFGGDIWKDKMSADGGDAYIAFVPLKPFGLFLLGLSLVHGQGENAQTLSGSEQLSGYIKEQTKTPSVCVIQAHWNHASGVVIFPDKNSTPYSIFISHAPLYDEPGISPLLYQWKEENCSASVLHPQASSDLWREYRLRSVFAEICNAVLLRFETLAGRALMESLVRVMASFSAQQDLDLSIASRRLEDHEVFFSSETAARMYGKYLAEMFEHCSVVIGQRLLASVLREILAGFSKTEKDFIKQANLLPRGYYYD